VALLLLETKTNLETHHLCDARTGLLEQLLDADVRILDERLPGEGDLIQVFAQSSLDHLGNDLRGLALGLPRRLITQDAALAIDGCGWHVRGLGGVGECRRDAHCHGPWRLVARPVASI